MAGIRLKHCLPLFTSCLCNRTHFRLHHSACIGRALGLFVCFFPFFTCVGSGQRVLQPQLWQPGLIERQRVRGKTNGTIIFHSDWIYFQGERRQSDLCRCSKAWIDTAPFFFFLCPLVVPSLPLPPPLLLILELRFEKRELPCLLGMYSFFLIFQLCELKHMGFIPPFILSLSFHRPQRRSPLNHPEAGKEKLTPIRRVVKVSLMLVR